jgi:O-antigen/teichoic acid export membrane protein
VVANGLLLALLGWAIRGKAYGQIAANRLTRAGTGAVTQAGFGLLGWGAFGLLLGAILGIVVALARFALTSWRTDAATFKQASRSGVERAARRYRRFPLLTAPAMFLNTVGLEAPLLAMVALFGTTVGGQFALAYRVMALPLTLVANAIGKTFFAEAARVVREDPAGLRRLYLRTTGSIAALTILPVLLGALLAPFVFGLVFGEEWTEAGLFAAILAPMFYLQLLTNPTHGTLIVLERQDLHLQREIARLLLLGGVLLIVIALDLEPVGAVAAISVAGVMMYSWYGITSWRAIVAADAARAVGDGGSGADDDGSVDRSDRPGS